MPIQAIIKDIRLLKNRWHHYKIINFNLTCNNKYYILSARIMTRWISFWNMLKTWTYLHRLIMHSNKPKDSLYIYIMDPKVHMDIFKNHLELDTINLLIEGVIEGSTPFSCNCTNIKYNFFATTFCGHPIWS